MSKGGGSHVHCQRSLAHATGLVKQRNSYLYTIQYQLLN